MVKFHESTFSHDYPFPAVTLAYFLRYPNPYASHVLSTDVIDRHFDPTTQRLYTARLHLKRSKLPAALTKILPTSWLGASSEGTSQSYILERSVVDVRDGVMITESRNLDFTGVLVVVERQLYSRPVVDLAQYFRRYVPRPGFPLVPPSYDHMRPEVSDDGTTNVLTKIELISKLGEGGRRRLWGRAKAEEVEDEPPKVGFFQSLSRNSIQRSIEAVGLRRAERAVPNSKKGMNIVLERLRHGGLVAVLEGMRRDREEAFAAEIA